MFTKELAKISGCIFLLVIPAFAHKNPQLKSGLREAEELYQRAQYDASLSLLDRRSKDPASLFLMGRDYYMLGDFSKALRYLKAAVAADPENAEFLESLGCAYARRAETLDPLRAAVLGKKAQQAYERAVQLNPKNADALSDLFDYYLHTPAVLGGGYGKAETVAERMSAIDPTQAFSEEWKLSEGEVHRDSHASPEFRRKRAPRRQTGSRDLQEGD
jgi:tetratricopeptide (TPR) repeat protein